MKTRFRPLRIAASLSLTALLLNTMRTRMNSNWRRPLPCWYLTPAKRVWLQRHRLVAACMLLSFFLGACHSSADTESSLTFPNFFIEPVLEQQTKGRAWRDVDIVKLFDLPSDSLWNPVGVKVDQGGHIYVLDFGDTKVKRYTPSGAYVTSYGAGSGQGPGELLTMIDAGAVADSLVYIVDNSGRRVLFFSFAGAFLRHEAYDSAPVRYQMTQGGRGYTLISHSPTLFRSQLGDDVSDFGALVEGQSGRRYSLATGFIATYRQSMLYVPSHFPVIVRYNPDGSVAYARTTPDYGQVELPKMGTIDLGGMTAYRVEGGRLHGDIGVDDNKVFVHARTPSSEDFVDVYQAETGDYAYSFRIPDSLDTRHTYIKNDRMYHVLDTSSDIPTVTVFGLRVSPE